MPRPLLVISGIAFLVIAVAEAVGIIVGAKFPVPIIALVILVIVYVKVVRHYGTSLSAPHQDDDRVAGLEGCVTDLQDILISVDERLARLEPSRSSEIQRA